MRIRFLLVVGLAFLAVGLDFRPAQAQSNVWRTRVTNLTPIPLRQGVNRVERFAPDGREAQIVLAWRDNGNAHGFDLFLVMLPGRVGAQDWNVVGVDPGEPGQRFQDVIVDQPHLGENMVRSVRFARGRLDGQAATFLFAATREIGDEGYGAPSATVFEVFRLIPNTQGPGVTRDHFERLGRWRSTTRSCNAEIALADEIGFAARRQRDWPNTPDGCPSRR